ncbi:Outer membrane efflux protein [Phycisphaerae bacterium RAS1]|nr:Outer membrane efflux protein [Phycisphaerae bacterium RAS1]
MNARTACYSLLIVLASGCVLDAGDLDASLSAYRERMLASSEDPPAGGEPLARPATGALPPRNALVTSAPSSQPSSESILFELPDPTEAASVFARRLQALRDVPRQEERVIKNYEGVQRYANEYLAQVARPTKVKLSLSECIQRALEHNFEIRVESYNPAISQTQIVEAEAAFDTEFFLDSSYSPRDNATASTLQTGKSDTRLVRAGIRQLLPSGMQVSTSVQMQRFSADFQFQRLNPAYSSSFVAEFRQPLMRGFGLDVNRAQINARRVEFNSAYEVYTQRVRDRLLDVERAYWRLLAARRIAAVFAETLAQNRVTAEGIEQRRFHDATEVEIQNSRASFKQREVQYIETVKKVKDAEDILKGLLNDPELLLSRDIELVPTDLPLIAGLALDQFAEVRAALDERSEIRQARLAVDGARINTGVAKNQTMPQLDLAFQYEVQGVGGTADNSFGQLTQSRFQSYNVTLTFSVPIGNRARLAAWNRARTQETQAMTRVYQVMEAVVVEVNTAVRNLVVRFSQIAPQYESANAAERNLRALQARTAKIDPAFLDTELRGVEQLNSTRQTLLQIITDYNISIAELERAKGTLLTHYNIVLTDEPQPR